MPIRRLVLSLHVLRIPFHIVALAADVYVGWWVLKNCEPHTWPGHLAMLTHWGHLLQTIYLAFVLLQDFKWLVSSSSGAFQHRYFCILIEMYRFIFARIFNFGFWVLRFCRLRVPCPRLTLCTS
jgi:hypothetical protein